MPTSTVESPQVARATWKKMPQHQGATMWPVRLHRVVAVKTSAYEEMPRMWPWWYEGGKLPDW